MQLEELWSHFELMHAPGAAPSRPGPRSCVKYEFEQKFVVVHRTLFNQGVHEIPIRVLMHILDPLATTGAFKGSMSISLIWWWQVRIKQILPI